MNSSLVGLIMAVAVFLTLALFGVKNPLVFLDWHAALIVIGGTASAALLSFSSKNIALLFKIFMSRVLRDNQKHYSDVISEIVDIAKNYRTNANYLAEVAPEIKTHFLREGIEMMLEGGMSDKEIDMIMMKRAKTHYVRYEQDAHMFTTLAKFPPAFGLLGAVVGIVSLMQGLGGADAIKTVGPAMATALIATLYGIAVANFIFIPVGENLSKFNKQDKITRQMILDGMKMIRARKHPLLVEENLKSYLLPSERALVESTAKAAPSETKKAA